METNPPPADPAEQRWRPLDATQRRVLGVLIEKAKTTPAGYPMSVNAVVAGCNQKNNRDPLVAYDDFDVEKALSELQTLGVVKEIDWVGRVPKYKHLAYEWLGVRPVELAVLGELLLRGPQTLGDLRGRASRMEPIEDLSALKPIVESLIDRKLIIELTPPGRGQLVTHNLYPASERPEARPQTGSPRPSAAASFSSALERYHSAADEFSRGDPEPVKRIFSHREDVTLANPFGRAEHGWQQVSQALDFASSRFRNGRITGFDSIAQYATPELVTILELERWEARVGGREDKSSFELRVSSTFRLEEGAWRLVHRHADPISTAHPDGPLRDSDR
jgi:uncharacterized protein YceH (UPF0502 family)